MLLGAVAWTGCTRTGPTVGGSLDSSASPAAAPEGARAADLRDPRADLDPAAWPARDADAVRAAAEDILAQAPDPAAARRRADALVGHLMATHLSPRALAGRSTEDVIAHLRAQAAPLWAAPFEDALRGPQRPHVATQFAPGLEPVGDAWAAPRWRIADGRVHLTCIIAHAVLRPQQARIAVYAVQVQLSVLIEGEDPVRGMDVSAVMHGADLCATRASGGLVVPAFDADRQRRLREGLLVDPASAPADGAGIGNQRC